MSRAAMQWRMARQVQEERRKALDGSAQGDDGAEGAALQQNVSSKNMVPMRTDAHGNVGHVLFSRVQASPYFAQIKAIKTFHELLDEIFRQVSSLEPWAASGVPSSAFCILVRLFAMKLTKKQLSKMLDHPDSPFIRALGFLFVRFACPPEDYWGWFEPHMLDEQRLRPNGPKSREISLDAWLKSLLTDHKFNGIVMPRIPRLVSEGLQGCLGKVDSEKRRLHKNLKRGVVVQVGSRVQAKYAQDDQWYEAEVAEVLEKPNHFVVRFVEYGNEEIVSLGNIQVERSSRRDRSESPHRRYRTRSPSRERRRSRSRSPYRRRRWRSRSRSSSTPRRRRRASHRRSRSKHSRSTSSRRRSSRRSRDLDSRSRSRSWRRGRRKDRSSRRRSGSRHRY